MTLSTSMIPTTVLLLLFINLPTSICAFSPLSSSSSYLCSRRFAGSRQNAPSSILLSMSNTATEDNDIQKLKSTILTSIEPTKRGLSATSTQKSTIESQIQRLESYCMAEPARDEKMDGKWKVEYTTAPPPSNGQLGPFVGIARQVIDLDTKRYSNLLIVDPNEWLSATLDATWEEWDGVFLEKVGGFDGDNATSSSTILEGREEEEQKDDNQKKDDSPFGAVLNWFRQSTDTKESTSISKKTDYGATSWRVTFDSLTIRFFGIPIVTKKFENTARVWRMSYLDDDTRVVRAGQTGKSEDDVVFYMTRE